MAMVQYDHLSEVGTDLNGAVLFVQMSGFLRDRIVKRSRLAYSGQEMIFVTEILTNRTKTYI